MKRMKKRGLALAALCLTAALALAERTSPADLPVRVLQSELRADGVYLDEG